MEYKPGRPKKPPNVQEPHKEDGCCLSCENARQRFRDSCYCVKYGITIGYSKDSCRGWVREK